MTAEAKAKQKIIAKRNYPDSWHEVNIGELGKVITGKTPSTKEEDNFGGKYPFITIPDLKSDKYIKETERTISEKGLDTMRNQKLPANAVMMSCLATIGETGITTKESVTNQQINSVVCDSNVVRPEYLYYAFNDLRPRLKKYGGSVYTNISKSKFSNIEIALPPLEEQKRIASILSAFDEKIELNNQISRTLEEMAQAIFKHWFVDFKFPGHEDVDLVDSELGKIPEGWEVKTLDEFFPVTTGKENANIATEDGDYAFFTCAQDVKRADQYSFEGSAILLAGNGEFNIKWHRGKFEAYQRTYVLMPQNEELFGFLYYLTRNFLKEITSGSRGSVIDYLTKSMITDYKVVVPPEEKLDDMADIFNDVIDIIENLREQNQTLSSIRDTLLPKLMSGEIRV